MKNRIYLLVIAFFALTNCTPNSTEELEIDSTITTNISGIIQFTDLQNIIGDNASTNNWTLGENSKLQLCVSKNLTLNPYNLKMTITVDENDPTAPIIYFSSDFDRKIVEGDKYRLMTTIILNGDNQVIAGQTGGKIGIFANQYYFGMGLGSELEITVGNEGETVVEGSQQLLNFTGFFVEDDNNLSTQSIGTFSIQIDGNNIINTSIF